MKKNLLHCTQLFHSLKLRWRVSHQLDILQDSQRESSLVYSIGRVAEWQTSVSLTMPLWPSLMTTFANIFPALVCLGQRRKGYRVIADAIEKSVAPAWYIDLFVNNTVYIYLSHNSENVFSSTPRPSVSCPPHWIEYRNEGADGGQGVSTATTQQRCLDTCIANSSCVAAEWGSWGCYIHDRYRRRIRHNKHGVTHFEIVRHCYPKSGIRPHRWFLHTFFSFD